MAWHYFNENREKIGPVTSKELKQLVQEGTITPDTFVEDPTGRTGLAKDVNGLPFPEPIPPIPVPQPVPPPEPTNVFCTNCGTAVSEQAVACATCGARPTEHKKFCWHCGVGVNPEQVICIKCGVELTRRRRKFHQFAPDTKKLNTCFMVWWICAATALSLGLIGAITMHLATTIAANGGNPDSLFTLGFAFTTLSLPVSFGGTIFCCILLYLLWKLIPTDIARTTPGKAVGFLFIPFFNFYWFFVAYKGLGEDMNKTLQRRGIPYQTNVTLGLTWSILAILCYLPLLIPPSPVTSYIATLFATAYLVVGVFFLNTVKSGAIALLESEGV